LYWWIFCIDEAVPKLQFLEQLLTPGENCMSRKSLPYKKLAIFSESLFQNQPGFGTSSDMQKIPIIRRAFGVCKV
jgi:hypothetical protein